MLNQAYVILNDPKKRKIYDKVGLYGLRAAEQFQDNADWDELTTCQKVGRSTAFCTHAVYMHQYAFTFTHARTHAHTNARTQIQREFNKIENANSFSQLSTGGGSVVWSILWHRHRLLLRLLLLLLRVRLLCARIR